MSTAEKATHRLVLDKHSQYIANYGKKTEIFEYEMTDHLRMNGIYWGLTALALMGKLDLLDLDEISTFVLACQHPCGGFGACPGHDPHMLSTLSAVQIMLLIGQETRLDAHQIATWVGKRQNPDGSFNGDEWGEVDTRFTFCALATLALLGLLKDKQVFTQRQCTVQSNYIDVDKAVDFVVQCKNFDEGFGNVPGSESHAGQIYCCVGALAIANSLFHVDADALGWWLAERQVPSGGLNGRPEKLPDVCYSWWVLSVLKIIKRSHWIDQDKLASFILASQDEVTGGFSDRPGDAVDPFHTLFGLAALSMLGSSAALAAVNPIFCLPQSTLARVPLPVHLIGCKAGQSK